MVSENFLPAYKLRETQVGTRNTLPCRKRDKAVPATPEERVRQRILRWLVAEKQWPVQRIELERSYDWVGDPNRHRVRPDIELLDDGGRTLVVVECKAPQIPLWRWCRTTSVRVRDQIELKVRLDLKRRPAQVPCSDFQGYVEVDLSTGTVGTQSVKRQPLAHPERTPNRDEEPAACR